MKRQRVKAPENNTNQKPMCKYYLSGTCTKSPCMFRHDSDNRLENLNRRKLQERRERIRDRLDQQSFAQIEEENKRYKIENSELKQKNTFWIDGYYQMKKEKSEIQEKAKCDIDLMSLNEMQNQEKILRKELIRLKDSHRKELAHFKAQCLHLENKADQLVFIHNQEKSDLQEKLRIMCKEKQTYEIQLQEKMNETKFLQRQFLVDCQAFQKELDENKQKSDEIMTV